MPLPRLTVSAFPALPPLLMSATALALWLAIDHTPAGIAGWTVLLFPLATVAAILTTALAPRTSCLGYALLTWLAAILLIVLLPHLGPALWGLLAAWSALCTAATWALRRFGPVCSAACTLTIASLAMAAPVAAMPLIHAAAHWGPWQNRLVQCIAQACPFFPALQTLRPAIQIDWGTLPGMYAWSGLGQEIPLALPDPWRCAALYAGLALLFGLLGWLLRPRHAARSA